jgi:hypothetical protein
MLLPKGLSDRLFSVGLVGFESIIYIIFIIALEAT